jgi:hypothetical protein
LSRQLVLNASASVTLDVNGNGQAQLGPTLPGTSWQVGTIAVQVTTNVNEAQCNVYVGIQPIAGSLIGATSTGSTGDSDDLGGQNVWPGQSIIAVWEGGDAGSVATISVFGQQTVP